MFPTDQLGSAACIGKAGKWLLLCAVFTNRIEDLRLQDLAEVDLREVIYQVQEFFGDFAVLDPHHFAVPIQQNQVTLQPFTWDYGRR